MLILKRRQQKGLRVSSFALLLVVFKRHHGSEGVNYKLVVVVVGPSLIVPAGSVDVKQL